MGIYIKKKFIFSLGFFLCFFIGVSHPIFAGLVEEVDNLSPEDSNLVIRKLIAKTAFPLPENMITNLGLSYGWNAHALKVSGVNTIGLDKFSVIYGDGFTFRYRFTPKFGLGIDYSKAKRTFIEGVTATQFKEREVGYSYIHLIADYIIFKEETFSLKGIVGLGQLNGYYQSETFGESSSVNYERLKRTSSIWNYQGGIEANYYLNPIWTIGMGLYYFSGNLKKFDTIAGTEDEDASEMDLSGTVLKIFTGLNL